MQILFAKFPIYACVQRKDVIRSFTFSAKFCRTNRLFTYLEGEMQDVKIFLQEMQSHPHHLPLQKIMGDLSSIKVPGFGII